MTTVAIAGSRALPPGIAARLLVRFLGSLPDGSRILLRRGAFAPANMFETQVRQLCDLLLLDVVWCRPQPRLEQQMTETGNVEVETYGRESTLARDLRMVQLADLVLCFYDESEIGDETSGTQSLVDKAMAAETPVYAYALHGDRMERVGEHDPGDKWASKVPG